MGQNLAHPVCRIPSPDEPCSKQPITRKGKNHFGGSPFHVMQSGVTLAISFLWPDTGQDKKFLCKFVVSEIPGLPASN